MALLGQLTVTPEQLDAQANVVEGELSAMSGYFENLKAAMDGTVQYWIGEAGNAHRELYNGKLGKIEEMLARYGEHVRDLRIMGGVYREAEQTAASTADSLPPSTLD